MIYIHLDYASAPSPEQFLINYSNELTEDVKKCDELIKDVEAKLKLDPNHTGNLAVLDNLKQSREKTVEDMKSKDFVINVEKTLLIGNPKEKEKIKEWVSYLSSLGGQVNVQIVVDPRTINNQDSETNYIYTREEFNELIVLNNDLSALGMSCELLVNETDIYKIEESWSLSFVKEANNRLDIMVNTIKDKNLSPFEAMLFIYTFITSNFVYKLDENGTRKDSSFISALLTKERYIKCSGYASFTKAIIDKLNMNGLSSNLLGVEFYDRKQLERKGSHCLNFVQIDDPKYNIDGCYLTDSCHGAKRADSDFVGQGVAHCLYPISDLYNLQNLITRTIKRTDRYNNWLVNAESSTENLRLELYDIEKAKEYRDELIEKRKQMFSKPDQLEVKYQEYSVPIDLQTYTDGLTRVFEISGLGKTKEEVEKNVQDYLKISQLACEGYFNTKCLSSLYSIDALDVACSQI